MTTEDQHKAHIRRYFQEIIRKGNLEAGKDADMAVFDVKDYREIAYWFAWDRCVEMVVAGRVVGSDENRPR